MTVAKSKIIRPYAPDYVDATTLAYRLCVSELTVEKLERERQAAAAPRRVWLPPLEVVRGRGHR